MTLKLPANPALGRMHAKKRALLRDGREIIDLSMINPDLPAPRILIDKLVEAAVRPTMHRYAVARGVARLRGAFAGKYDAAFDVAIDDEKNVCVTFGSKDAVLHALMCIDDTRKKRGVLLGEPVYPAHRAALELLGFSTHFFALESDESSMLGSIRGAVENNEIGTLLLNFPNNPTGLTVSAEFWKALVDLATERDLLIINDFVYGELQYGCEAAPSLLAADPNFDQIAEVYSLSKAYSVPGWRVGALLGNSSLVGALSKLKSQVDYGLFLPLQHAAAEALLSVEGFSSTYCERYAQRAGVLVAGLQEKGFRTEAPRAGCCVWAQLPNSLRISAEEFSDRLLESEGVAVLPGTAFGDDFSREIRLALVHDEGQMREVVDAIGRVLDAV